MTHQGPFARPPAWHYGVQSGIVTNVVDPDGRGRVQVQLLGPDADNLSPVWARVVVPYAGDNFGAFLIPDVGQEVLVALLAGDPRHPVVLGALWNGKAAQPETIGGSSVDRWTLTGKNGTRIAIVEEASGQEKVQITTPNEVTLTLTDASGGSVELKDTSGNSIKLEPAGITIQASAKVTVNASQVAVSAGMVQVDAGMSKFSGVVQCDTLIATTVVSSTYTPGAGNIW